MMRWRGERTDEEGETGEGAEMRKQKEGERRMG